MKLLLQNPYKLRIPSSPSLSLKLNEVLMWLMLMANQQQYFYKKNKFMIIGLLLTFIFIEIRRLMSHLKIYGIPSIGQMTPDNKRVG
jgi:hypothetical protein